MKEALRYLQNAKDILAVKDYLAAARDFINKLK